jgi:hypothetical protein
VLPHSPSPGTAVAHAIEEAKYRAFVEFDAAFREITVECYRCERSACPDCWDEDNRMCGACVHTHGLQRSPHRGIHAAPLADGRMRRSEPGQFSDAARPGWLNELLAAQPPGSPAGGQPGTSSAMWQGLNAIAPGQPEMPALTATPEARLLIASAGTEGSVAEEPTRHIGGVTPPPARSGNGTSGRLAAVERVGRIDVGDYASPEGKATSSMVECPRCRTANYDFVTRCTVCQLQLIQICPLCERLNPGHAAICEACGSPLDRPSGWSDVHARVTQLSVDEARRRREHVEPPSKPVRRIRLTRPKRGDSGRIPATQSQGWDQPALRGVPLPAMLAATPPVEAAVAGGAAVGAMPLASQQAHEARPALYALDGDGGMWTRVLVALERATTAVLLFAILALVGAVVGAELSPGIDAALKGMIHVDIREAIANFWTVLQDLWQRYRR